MMPSDHIKDLIANADGIVILAGAGMSVDSGIPDFRGKDGIWTSEQSNFMKFATADAFDTEPLDAWNFYITRLLCYNEVLPHEGYHHLLKLQEMGKDIYVVTSNVDGQFLRAGYDADKIFEIHGDLRNVQCSKQCCRDDWLMPSFKGPLSNADQIPKCPKCGHNLRPKVMMFNDPYFCFNRVDQQQAAYSLWASNKKQIVGIEIGAGKTVPSIRWFGAERTTHLIRINPHEPDISRPQDISIGMTAAEGIQFLIELLTEQQ